MATRITKNQLAKKDQELKERRLVVDELIANAMTQRSNYMNRLLDARRDIDAECGYTRVSDLTLEHYQTMYDAEGIAQRVVEVLPEETWKVQPSIYEDEDPDSSTSFEESWTEFCRGLLGEESWYGDEAGNPVWEYLGRVDKLSGIGYYGVLLLGLDDGKPLNEPVEGNAHKVTFLRCFSNHLASIAAFETDPSLPRYGKPTSYNLKFSDPSKVSDVVAFEPSETVNVHWTRVLHVADTLESSEVFAVPRMRPVFNRLQDLQKLYAGSAEMYWLGALPGLAFETHPQLGADWSDDSLEGVREAVMAYKDGLQRHLAVAGTQVKTLAPQVVDPSAQIDKILEAICIKLGIPKRVFMGSERGELSSGQDKDTWNERLVGRQKNYVTPRIIVPFIDRLIMLGVLQEPKEEYHIEWPDLDELRPKDQVEIAARKTEAIVKYVGGNGDNLIEPEMFLTKILGIEEDEAKEIIDATAEYVEEQEPTTAELLEQQQLEQSQATFEREQGESNGDNNPFGKKAKETPKGKPAEGGSDKNGDAPKAFRKGNE